MNNFTIKDLENLSGIKAHTIRIWEQRYSLIKPFRTDTNIRYYTNDELKKVLNIALLNKYGYKISHIDKMTDDEMKEKILSLGPSDAQHERIVNDLIKKMVDMDIESFEAVLDNYILARGIERAIPNLIFPFLEKVGILWLTNHINPAQEHLVTNVIRQKLIVGIDGVSSPLKISKKILLFLPEGEYHELGLLYLNYILKSKGITTIYLGANIPSKDVTGVINLLKPDYLYTHLTTLGSNFNIDKFLSGLMKSTHKAPIVVSGQLTKTITKKLGSSVLIKRSFAEVMDFVSSLL